MNLQAKLYEPLRGSRVSGNNSAVIALHGWLDNAGSFAELFSDASRCALPALENRSVICIDFAGQGKSPKRASRVPYSLQEDCRDLRHTFKKLEADGVCDSGEIHLIGHSRGAMVAWMFACLYPECVASCCFIDGLLPPPLSSQDYAKGLRKALSLTQDENASAPDPEVPSELQARKPSRFKTMQEAVAARINSRFAVTAAVASAMALRAVREDAGQFYWDNDLRLKQTHPYRLTSHQAFAIGQSFAVPATLLWASRGVLISDAAGRADEPAHLHPKLAEYCQTFSIEAVGIDGEHHCHMGESLPAVLHTIEQHFAGLESREPQPSGESSD